MFGFSPVKILFTIVVIGAIWYGFKWLSRMQDKTAEKESPSKHSSADQEISDLVACPKCGSYNVKGKKCSCGDGDLS